MKTKTILAVFAVVFTLVAAGLGIAALAIPVWWNFEDYLTIGLFRSCVTIFSVTICDTNGDVPTRFEATRWLVVSACVLLCFALLLGFLLLCLKNKCLAITACVLDVVAGLCMLAAVGITVYDTSNSDAAIEYGLSFILACVCAFFAIVAGIIFAFAKPKKSGSRGRVIQPM